MFPEQKPESTAVQRLSSDFGALYSSTSVKNWAWNISQEEHQAFHTLSFCVLQLLSDQYGFYPFLIHSFPSLVPRDALFRLCFPATEGKKKIALWKSDQDSYIILEIWAALNDSLLYLSLLKGEMTPSLQAKLFRAIRFWCCPSNPSCQDGKIIGENGPFVFFPAGQTSVSPGQQQLHRQQPERKEGLHEHMRPCVPQPAVAVWEDQRHRAGALQPGPQLRRQARERVPQRSRNNENLSAGHKRSFSAIPVCLHQKDQKCLVSINWISIFATQVSGSERRMCWFRNVPPCVTPVIRHTASFRIQWSGVSSVFRKTGKRKWTSALWKVKILIIILDSWLVQGGGACLSCGSPKTQTAFSETEPFKASLKLPNRNSN